MFKDDPNVVEYVADLDNMHKVVLEAKDEETIKKLSQTLTENNVDHKLWIEQPEDYPTCLVTKPYRKENIQKHFKGLKLFK